MAETLGVVCPLRGHTTRPISDCCTTNLGLEITPMVGSGVLSVFPRGSLGC